MAIKLLTILLIVSSNLATLTGLDMGNKIYCGVFRHSAGKCVEIRSDNYALILTSYCINVFCLYDTGYLEDQWKKKCVGVYDHGLYLYTCTESISKWVETAGGSIKDQSTGECWHPSGGSATPPENTPIVTWSGCDEVRLQFKRWTMDVGKPLKCGYLVHGSGMCVSHNIPFYRTFLTDTCSKTFCYTDKGFIQEQEDKTYCMEPWNSYANGNQNTMYACNEHTAPYDFTAKGSLKLRKSGLCVHPKGGNTIPESGTDLIIYNVCDEARLKFQIYDSSEFNAGTGDVGQPVKCGTLMHYSLKCVKYELPKTTLTLITECNKRFCLTDKGFIQEQEEKKYCLRALKDDHLDEPLRIFLCNDRSSKFQFTRADSLQLQTSKFCVHAKGGSRAPKNNTLVVIHSNCNYEAIEFYLYDNDDTCSLTEVGEDVTFLKMKCRIRGYKCPRTEEYYKTYTSYSICDRLFYNNLCSRDNSYYQVCGHHPSNCGLTTKQISCNRKLFCGVNVCDHQDGLGYTSGNSVVNEVFCNGIQDCRNDFVDELECPYIDPNTTYLCQDRDLTKRISKTKLCDNTCDCQGCDDELQECNPYNECIWCMQISGNPNSCVPPEYMCDTYNNCNNKADEDTQTVCNPETIIRYCKPGQFYVKWNYFGEKGRPVFPNQICAVPSKSVDYHVCQDGMDQINCTDPLKVAMECTMSRNPITISIFTPCKGFSLCDDDYQNNCVLVEIGCTVHKSQLCDGVKDCKGGGDEACGDLTNTTMCVRRLRTGKIGLNETMPFPTAWIMDGVKDCMNGIDENPAVWVKCDYGKGIVDYYDKGYVCDDVFLCPSDRTFVPLEKLCDRLASCAAEKSVCDESRDVVSINNKLDSIDIFKRELFYCLPGLERQGSRLPACISSEFRLSLNAVEHTKNVLITYPGVNISCSNLYGETFVYASCLGLCYDAECPRKVPDGFSCINIPKEERVYTLTSNYEMTVVSRADGSYISKYFTCENNNCVPYDKVCDLVDDCGDGSDEIFCNNHFQCVKTGEYVPISVVCDGRDDCRDRSDECHDGCDPRNRFIFETKVYRITSFVFGLAAVVFNLIAFGESAAMSRKISSAVGRMNSTLIMMISLADFLMGCYLVAIAFVDTRVSESYCDNKYLWLASTECALLGVLNTIASHLSLFAMTTLSLYRLINITNMVSKDGRSIKQVLKITAVCVIVAFIPILLASIPLLETFEDFFVNGLLYSEDNNLFTGTVSKELHMKIFTAYLGRSRTLDSISMSWQQIRRLTQTMFSDKYGGITSKRIHFYGNSGVCVFKYLVTKKDPQVLYSMVILVIDLVCFIFISCSYIYIYTTSMMSARTSGAATRSNATSKRNRKLQQKVSIIIATDFFCWVPFILLCWLHFTGTINGGPYYPLFSVVILPINSVINPLLYSNLITKKSKKALQSAISGSTRIFRHATRRTKNNNVSVSNSRTVLTNASSAATTTTTHFANTYDNNNNNNRKDTNGAFAESAT